MISTKLSNLWKHLLLLTRSIRFRLTLWFVIILGVVITFFSVFVYLRQVQEARIDASDRLALRAQRLGMFLRFASRQNFERLQVPSSGGVLEGEPLLQADDVFVLVAPDGHMISYQGPVNADSANQLVVQAIQQGKPEEVFSGTRFLEKIPNNGTSVAYAFLYNPFHIQDRVVGYFLIGSPVDPSNRLPRLLVSLIFGSLGTLVVALVGGVWLADRAMRPVKHITEAARAIGASDLSLRLHLERKDELGELAATFDKMLSRLEAAFDRQRQFTTDVSHELRTPLTIVDLETARALATSRSQPEYESALKVIRSENQFMARMVNHLLTLARMDDGQVMLQKEELDLSDVVLEVIERLAPIAVKDDVRLSTGNLPEVIVLGDRQYLEEMMINLVENAIKYTQGEDRRVQVEVGQRASRDGFQGWVRVVDNGPGIPAEHLAHLFDRFYQVDRARTRQASVGETQSSGTGLGLSIAQWIARAHTGEITVQSEPGIGTSFEVILPVADSDAARLDTI